MRPLDQPHRTSPTSSTLSLKKSISPTIIPFTQTTNQEMSTIFNSGPILNKDDLEFTVGTVVECKMYFDEIITGEVLAFEYDKKILVLKNPSTTSNTSSNITCINLGYCADIKVIHEQNSDNNNSNNTKLPEMNTDKLEERVKTAIKERNNLIDAYKSGASSDGISLYQSLIKTLGGSVTMEALDDNKNMCIVIKKHTKIIPPYSVNCVQPATKSGGPMLTEAINYARQLVAKFWRDQNKDPFTLAPYGGTGGGINSSTAIPVTNNNTLNNNNVNNGNTANINNTNNKNSISSSTGTSSTSKESSNTNSVATLSPPSSSGSSTPITTIASTTLATASTMAYTTTANNNTATISSSTIATTATTTTITPTPPASTATPAVTADNSGNNINNQKNLKNSRY